MNKKQLLALTEESVIFLSIFKWVSLASLIGAMVGTSTTFFLKVLNFSSASIQSHPYFYFLLPFGLFISALLIYKVSPDSEGHGTEKVIEAIHKRSGNIRARVIPIKILATIVTIATGGSAGKEGPSAQIGASLASVFSNLFKFTAQDRKKLVICGISAGFASVFGTPIAGAIFGVEVLFVGTLMYDVLLPSFVAGMVGFQISRTLGMHYHYTPINLVSDFDPMFFVYVVIAGVFFGLVCIFFIEILKYGERVSKKINVWPPFKGLIGGVVLILIAYFFSTDYLSLGLDTIDQTLNGESVPWYAFILKTITTTITISFGGSGGILTPIFFVGSTSGSLFAQLFNLSIPTFAAFGFVSLLAGSANTPIAASILAVELFGPEIAPHATIVCVICFLMTGYRSAFASQVLSINKTHAIMGGTGCEIETRETHFEYKTRKTMASGRRALKKSSIKNLFFK